MSYNHNPTFHQDGTITYWVDSYGWFHRRHPCNVPKNVVAQWRAQDRRKWAAAMIKRGFIQKGGVWQPAHEMKEV